VDFMFDDEGNDFKIEDDGEGIIIRLGDQSMNLREHHIFDLHLAIMALEKKRNYQRINAPDLYHVADHIEYCYGIMNGLFAIAKKSNNQIVGYVKTKEEISDFITQLKSLAKLIDTI